MNQAQGRITHEKPAMLDTQKKDRQLQQLAVFFLWRSRALSLVLTHVFVHTIGYGFYGTASEAS